MRQTDALEVVGYHHQFDQDSFVETFLTSDNLGVVTPVHTSECTSSRWYRIDRETRIGLLSLKQVTQVRSSKAL